MFNFSLNISIKWHKISPWNPGIELQKINSKSMQLSNTNSSTRNAIIKHKNLWFVWNATEWISILVSSSVSMWFKSYVHIIIIIIGGSGVVVAMMVVEVEFILVELNQIHNLICNLYRLHISRWPFYRNPKSISLLFNCLYLWLRCAV